MDSNSNQTKSTKNTDSNAIIKASKLPIDESDNIFSEEITDFIRFASDISTFGEKKLKNFVANINAGKVEDNIINAAKIKLHNDFEKIYETNKEYILEDNFSWLESRKKFSIIGLTDALSLNISKIYLNLRDVARGVLKKKLLNIFIKLCEEKDVEGLQSVIDDYKNVNEEIISRNSQIRDKLLNITSNPLLKSFGLKGIVENITNNSSMFDEIITFATKLMEKTDTNDFDNIKLDNSPIVKMANSFVSTLNNEEN